jgi:hypothetical protein
MMEYWPLVILVDVSTVASTTDVSHDDHILKLIYSTEAHCDKYYCIICEKERDLNH